MNQRFFFGRFSAISAINYVLTIIIYYLMIYYGFSFVISYIISSIIGYLFIYTQNSIFVFKTHLFNIKIIYYALYYILYTFFNTIILYFVVNILNISAYIAPFIITLFVLPFHFVFTSWIINSRRKGALLSKDLDELTDLHTSILPDSLFCMLGRSVCRAYWRASDRSENLGLIVKRNEQGRIVSACGFIRYPDQALRSLIMDPSFFVAIMLSLWRPAFWRYVLGSINRNSIYLPCCPEIVTLLTCPTQQRRGLATTAIVDCSILLKNERFSAMYVKTQIGNEPARIFYSKLGFILCATGLFNGLHNVAYVIDLEVLATLAPSEVTA